MTQATNMIKGIMEPCRFCGHAKCFHLHAKKRIFPFNILFSEFETLDNTSCVDPGCECSKYR